MPLRRARILRPSSIGTGFPNVFGSSPGRGHFWGFVPLP